MNNRSNNSTLYKNFNNKYGSMLKLVPEVYKDTEYMHSLSIWPAQTFSNYR
jgi:hypothetical protein